MPTPVAASGRGYLVRRRAEAPTVPCPCGPSTRILTCADGPLANVHVTTIRDAARHYHERSTEIYYILEGTGHLELGEDIVEVEPGTLIVIEPRTVHRLVSPGGVTTMVIGIPALQPDDEYLVEA
jgi:mannose-6-phosphate isomerase-like protein (cupin superfamily)